MKIGAGRTNDQFTNLQGIVKLLTLYY
jgi:hypothetical protein